MNALRQNTNKATGCTAVRRRGFTFFEMLIALTCTAMIGVAITSMLFAVVRGTSSSNDSRGLVLQYKLLTTRLDTSIRGSTKILACGSNYIVLWMSDSRANSAPDLSEIRRIEYNSTAHTVTSYRMPTSWTQSQIDSNEVNYQLTNDFATITSALEGGSSFPPEIWSTNVYGWTVALDNATAQNARLVSYRLTVQAGSEQTTVVSAAALRN